MWFYISNQLFVAVVGFILVHHFFVRRAPVRRFAANVLIFGLVALFVSAPLVQFALSDPDAYFQRTLEVSMFRHEPREMWAGRILEGLRSHALMFNRLGDMNPRHNLPGVPALDYVTGGLFAVGFLFAVTRWRSTAHLGLAVWTVVMMLPGALTLPSEAPQSLRSALAMPAVCVLAAYPLWRLFAAASGAPWALLRSTAAPMAAAAVALIGVWNLYVYFGPQASNPAVYAAFSTDQALMARSHAEQLARGYSIWTSRHYMPGMINEVVGTRADAGVVRPPHGLPLDLAGMSAGAAMYFEARERGFWELAREYYPGARLDEVRAPGGGDALYYAAFVDRGQAARVQGLRESYVFADGTVVESSATASGGFWHASRGPEEFPYELVLDGALRLGAPADLSIWLDGNMSAEMYIDDELVFDDAMGPASVRAAAGMHSVMIRADVSGPSDYLSVIWAEAGGRAVPVGLADFYRGSVRPLGVAGRFAPRDGGNEHRAVVPSLDVFSYSPPTGGPHLGVYEGSLAVEVSGEYQFVVEGHSGPARLYLDGALVAASPPVDGAGDSGFVRLDAGRTPLRVEHEHGGNGSTRLRVLWRAPESGLVPIPPGALMPSGDGFIEVLR